MDSKKNHKLSKATVATMLATSGVVIALPQTTNAYMFSDLNPSADYYQPIVELYNKNIVSGYADGTFKPNQAITRADAAKMLALALELNTTNPSNPQFSDVPRSNQYYRYIAALAEEGIISGYSDKTFKPNEPITRAQMAKIMTLGYKFGVSTKLNHGFKDVSSQNANAYFIQTLVDLNITKGKTPVTFEPFQSVTRGQMATFIWRAGQADAGDPTYTVGDVTGDKVYINGVAYTVASNLSSIFNAGNKRILQGAEIEGTFSGTTLTAVSKLTINANGNSSSLLAFDGSYSTYSGELVINGSYVRFKNWTLTGRVYVAETPRKSLADYTNRLQNIRIASLNGFGFIDWTTPTKPEEDDYLNPTDQDNLTPKPDPTKPNNVKKYDVRMPKIEKYVDFSNSILSNLYIEQNRSFVSSEETIDRVTVQRDVAQFELYADVNALYIDTDVDLTMYGVNDITYVYKNSYKSVHFNTDSLYDFLYVGNSSGWIDLGEHVYIDEVIIPPGKTPNDIFDDYENDNGQIGDIEDEDGKVVDRDPVEDTIIPDSTAPSILQLTATPGSTTAAISLTSDEDGTYYYIVQEASKKAPSISDIKKGSGEHNGKGSIVMDVPLSFPVNSLSQLMDYVIYVVVVDKADNVSNRADASFKTKDGTPPTIKSLKAEAMQGGKRARVSFTPSELGVYSYVIKGADEAAPTADDIWRTGKRTTLKAADLKGVELIDDTLSPNTSYVVYMVMDDVSGNRSPVVKSNTFATGALDLDAPTVKNMTVTDILKDPTKVLITFSEKMDKATAEDVKNYVLGGTGNLTGNPLKATLTSNGMGVTLEIPSMAAFVINDTLTVKISKVQDEAGNEIVDTTQTYKHREGETTDPEIKGINVNVVGPELSNQSVREATFESNAAGSFYYLIVPIDPTGQRLNPQRSDVLFPKEYLEKYPEIKYHLADRGEVSPGSNTTGPIKLPLDNLNYQAHPFGYEIYVAMQDRNGKFAVDVLKKVFIGDTGAPTITNWYANSLDINNNVIKNQAKNPFKYEDGKNFEFFVEFNEPMNKNSVESAANYEVRRHTSSTDTEGTLVTPTITYTETKDATTGNYSYRAKISVPSDRGTLEGVEYSIKFKNIQDKNGDNKVDETTVKRFIYEDLVKPRVKNSTLYRIDDHKDSKVAVVEMTFDEALDPATIIPANFTLTAKGQSTLGTTISGVELTGENNNVVKMTLTNVVDKYEYTVTVKDQGIIDRSVHQNTIDLAYNKAIYIYRKFNFEFRPLSPDLTTKKDGYLPDGTKIPVVTKMSIGIENVGLHANESIPYDPADIKYYYIMLGKNTTAPTVQEIIKPVTSIQKGEGTFEQGASITNAKFESQAGFIPGDKIYLVVADKYGNIVEAAPYTVPTITP